MLSNTVFSVDPTGAATLILSAADALPDLFASPRSIVTDASGNVFVSSRGGDNVFRVTPTGGVTAVPEPSYSTGVLTGIVVLSAMTRHRRRTRAL